MSHMPPHLATMLGTPARDSQTRRGSLVRPVGRTWRAPDWRRQLWQVYLAIGIAMIVVYFLLPNATWRSWTYDIFGPLAGLAIGLGVWVHRPPRPWIWLGLAAGSLLLGLGDLAFSALAINGASVPFPSFADGLYLSGYLLIAGSLILVQRLRRAWDDRANSIDASIIALALAFVSVSALIEGLKANPSADILAALTSLAYPAMDILFVWVAIRLVLASGHRRPALGLLVLGLITFLISDTEFAYGSANYIPGNLVDLGWLAGYLAWAMAAAHPSMRLLTAPPEHQAGRLIGQTRLVVLGLAAASPALGLLIQLSAGVNNIDFGMAIIESLIMVGLVFVRLSMMGLDLRHTMSERDGLVDEVTWRKQYDPLTSLANRGFFQEQAGVRLRHPARATAVLVLGLDDFGQVNDMYGHAAGDQVLAETAARLRACFHSGDLVARVGGDEFAILSETAEVQATALRVLGAISAPIMFEEQPLRMLASIGVALSAADEIGRDLLGDALVALHVAKIQAKGGYELFHPGMAEELAAANSLRADLERAIGAGEFEVFYQPVRHVANQALEGAEALVRWRHPSQGLVPPIKFIGLAEESGLIVPIGRFVLAQACAQAAAWIKLHPEHADFAINVNLSPAQMRSSDVVDDVAKALADSGLPPANLVLELTEGLLIDVERYEGTLHALKSLGVRLAMDDFGTGYSSLSYLGRLPFDILKIDRSFFLARAAGRPEGALIAVIRQIAATLGMTTVAEGIEGDEQFAYIRELGVDMVQSFMFGRPMPADEFAAVFGQAAAEAASAPTPAGPALAVA